MSIFSHFAGRRVLVVGDAMLDEHIQGQVRRLSPEAPVPIVEIQSRRFHPGGAANVAANITSLGGSALLVGIIGADGAAMQLRQELSRTHSRPGVLDCRPRPSHDDEESRHGRGTAYSSV